MINYLSMPNITYWGYTMWQVATPIIVLPKTVATLTFIMAIHNPSKGNCTFQLNIAEVNADGSFIRWLNNNPVLPDFGGWGGNTTDKTIMVSSPRADGTNYTAGMRIIVNLRRYDGNPVYIKSFTMQ